MSDVTFTSGNSGQPFDFPLLTYSLIFLLSHIAGSVLFILIFANGPLSRLHFQNMLQYNYLVKRPFGMTLLEQLGDAIWLVVCAACC